MRLSLVLALAGGCFIWPSAAPAASDLASRPPGVHVSLRGKVTLSGYAPLPVEDLPPGSYRFEAQGLGTARARGRLLRREGSVLVEPPGGPTSLFWPPGLKHLEQGETGRGLFLLAGAAGTGTMAIVNEVSRSEASDEADQAQRVYDQAVSEDAIRAARLDLESALDEESKEEEMRNLYLGYLGILWVGSAVEMWLLTPSGSLEDGPTLAVPSAGGAYAGIRSLLAPGSGQRAMGHSDRGNIFTLGVMGMGAVTLIAHEAYLQSSLEQSDAQRRYDAAETQAELELWRTALEDASEEADSRNLLRWILAGVTAGVWTWNVLDAWSIGNRAAEAAPLDLGVVPTRDGFLAALTWRIS